MANRHRSRMPHHEWERHKDIIRQLYLIEKRPLKGNDGIINLMMNKHNFAATKSQYETRFQRWNFHRNASREDWQGLDHVLCGREAEGKESEVYLFGNLLDKEKMRKQRARYRKHETNVFNVESSISHHLPPIFRVRTPTLTIRPRPEPPGETIQNHQITELDEVGMIVNESLPMDLTHTNFTWPCDEDLSNLALLPRATSPSDLGFSWPIDPLSTFNFENPFGGVNLQIRDSSFLFDPLGLELPWSSELSSLDQRSTNKLTMAYGTLCLLKGIDKNLFSVARTLVNELGMPLPGGFHSELQAFLPPSVCTQLCEQTLEHQFVGLLLSLLINNAVPYEALEDPQRPHEILLKRAIESLHTLSCSSLSQLLQSISLPYMQLALKKGIFRSAIEFGAARTTEHLLTLGIDPNKEIVCVEGDMRTPIEHLTVRCHADVFRVLLARGAESTTYNSGNLAGICIKTSRHAKPLEGAIEIFGLLAQASHAPQEIWYAMYNRSANSEFVFTFVQNVQVEHFRSILNHPKYGIVISGLKDEDVVSWAISQHVNFKAWEEHDPETTQRHCISASVTTGDLELFEQVVNSGAKLSAKFLDMAIQHGLLDFVSCLLERGVPLLSERENPLMHAIFIGNEQLIQLLQRNDAFAALKQNSYRLEEALAAAIATENAALTDLLASYRNSTHLSSGAGPQALTTVHDFRLDEIIGIVLKNDRENIVKKLLPLPCVSIDRSLFSKLECYPRKILHFLMESGYPIPGISLNVIFGAIQTGDTDLIQYCMDCPISRHKRSYWNISIDGWKSIFFQTELSGIAILKDADKETLDLLLQSAGSSKGLRIFNGKYRCTPLFAAVHRGKYSLMTNLINRGVDPWDEMAIWEASRRRDSQAIDLLLKSIRQRYPGKSTGCGTEGLKHAIRNRDMPTIRALIQEGDSNKLTSMQDGSYMSALGVAISNTSESSIEMIRILLDNGGNPNSITSKRDTPGNRFRKTALMEAIATYSIEKIKILLDADADIDFGARRGLLHTPLQYAADIGATNVVQYLLLRGAKPDGPPATNRGHTALQYAAAHGFIGIATMLVEKGASVNEQPCLHDGRTAFEAAAEGGRIDMLLFLFDHGADLLADNGRQYQRAREFSKAYGHIAAHDLIEWLHTRAKNDVMHPSLAA